MAGGNPFQDPTRFERRVRPCAMVIFGANGDLTRRKLIPALYRLAYERRLPPGFAVIGNSRTDLTDEQFRDKMRDALQEFLEDTPFDEHLWSDFRQSLFYFSGDLHAHETYDTLRTRLDEIDAARHSGGNVLFYLSSQPSHYEAAIKGIGY